MIDSGKKEFVFDIESNNLLDDATKIHCLSIGYIGDDGNLKVESTIDEDKIKRFFTRNDIIRVGHNIILYDERVIEKLMGITPNDSKIDTLALSWYLYPTRLKHGLESYGIEYNSLKVQIKDWKNLTSQEYIARCEQDVKINARLWFQQKRDLLKIYKNEADASRLIKYLQFKLDCVKEQEDITIRFDIEAANTLLNKMKSEQDFKLIELESAMPKVPIRVIKKYKNAAQLEDGTIIVKGDLWSPPNIEFQEELLVETIRGYEPPNANSSIQKKNWLYSMGWIPENFSEVKDKSTGEIRKIPQIASKNKDGDVCDSVKKLFNKEPKLEVLSGLSILSHRIGVVEGLIREQRNGHIKPSMLGFTNTLRLKHTGVRLRLLFKNYLNCWNILKPY